MKKLNIAVLFGGLSNEYDISLKSAQYILTNLSRVKFEIFPIGIAKNGRWFYYSGDIKKIGDGSWIDDECCCKPVVFSSSPNFKGFLRLELNSKCFLMKIDCIFLAMHGRNGEDGRLQGFFEAAHMPFVGCGMLSSALCMDKELTHKILETSGIKTTKFLALKKSKISQLNDFCKKVESEFSFPVFVKPANSGSSIGVFKCGNLTEVKNSVLKAFKFDDKVVCEQAVVNCKEVECGILGNDDPMVSNFLGEIKSKNDFYDFDSKYELDSQLIIPATINDSVAIKLKKIALKAFDVLECSGLARVDFFVDENDEIFLNELNTMPGFTQSSMFFKLWEKSGLKINDLLTKLIELAMEHHSNKHDILD